MLFLVILTDHFLKVLSVRSPHSKDITFSFETKKDNKYFEIMQIPSFLLHNGILLIHKKEILPFATTWMDLDSIMPNEISQPEKDKYHMHSLIYGI